MTRAGETRAVMGPACGPLAAPLALAREMGIEPALGRGRLAKLALVPPRRVQEKVDARNARVAGSRRARRYRTTSDGGRLAGEA